MNDPVQLHLWEPYEIDLSGCLDIPRNVAYIGTATRAANGMYRVLANVQGALCLVEVALTREWSAAG